ncbi:MAG: hypothetical protein ACFFCS_04395 [Candidatus Hodarchaeota archaeon]
MGLFKKKEKSLKKEEEDLKVENEQDIIEKIILKRETGWDEIGFSRPIGGFFYNYILFILGALIVLAIGTSLLPLIVPFPEIFGNQTIVVSYFKLMFLLFDAGLGDALGRYLPEYRIKNPKRALQYISFFIWFQMFTGLIQVSMISIFVFSWLPQMTISHLAWMILIYSTVQYPGMLSVFTNVLRSFQQFGKIQLISFLQDTLIQNITTVVFTLLFGWLFQGNPQFGFVFGASLGYIIGQYVDDFLSLLLGAIFFSQAMKATGYKARDSLIPQFNKEIMKECFKFGLSTLIGPIFGLAFEFVRLNIMLVLLPSYAVWIGLMGLARGIAGLANIAGPMATWTGISVSEAYNNKKENLCYHYMKNALKWQSFITFFFLPQLLITVPPLLESAISILGSNWLPAIPLIAPLTIEPLLATFGSMPMSIIPKVGKKIDDKITKDGEIEYQKSYGSHILERQGFQILESVLNFGVLILFIFIFPVNVYTFILAPIPVRTAFIIIGWAYIDRKIIKLKIKDWIGQGVIATGIATGIFLVFLVFLTYVLYPPMYEGMLDAASGWGLDENTAQYVALVPGVLILLAALLVFPSAIFAPLYAFFGGWDDITLEDFRKAAMLSGPSKGITMFMYRISKWVHDRSPLKNKFAFKNSDKALNEANELLLIRREKDAKVVKEKMGL